MNLVEITTKVQVLVQCFDFFYSFNGWGEGPAQILARVSAAADLPVPLHPIVERSRYAAGIINNNVHYLYLPNSGHL